MNNDKRKENEIKSDEGSGNGSNKASDLCDAIVEVVDFFDLSLHFLIDFVHLNFLLVHLVRGIDCQLTQFADVGGDLFEILLLLR